MMVFIQTEVSVLHAPLICQAAQDALDLTAAAAVSPVNSSGTLVFPPANPVHLSEQEDVQYVQMGILAPNVIKDGFEKLLTTVVYFVTLLYLVVDLVKQIESV